MLARPKPRRSRITAIPDSGSRRYVHEPKAYPFAPAADSSDVRVYRTGSVAKPPCVFHAQCGGTAGTSEHVFPAGLGGWHENTNILCDDCQPHFGDGLDRVLPLELGHFETILGIKSRHSGKVPRSPVTDAATGQRFLMNEHQAIVSAEPVLKETTVDDRGLEGRYYSLIGDPAALRSFDEAAFLKRLNETTGKTFEVVGRDPSKEKLIAPALNADTSFGGDTSFRAVARIALNFLAEYDGALARSLGLEPIKRWIREGAPPEQQFVEFADPLTEDQIAPLHFELGHRVALGFCSATQTISGRVTLFGVHDIAIRFGSAPCARGHIAVIDIDPKARHEAPGTDTRRFCAVPILPPGTLGAFSSDRDAVLERNRRRTAELKAIANERVLRARFAPLVEKLNKARTLLRFQQIQEIRGIIKDQQQMAFNLLLPTVRTAAALAQRHGYLRQAQFLLSTIEAEAGDVVVGKLGTLLAHQVLSAIGSDLLDLMAEGPVTFEVMRDLFEGTRGLRAACTVVTEAGVTIGLPMA